MAYIGASPTYGVFDRQVLTGDGTTTQFNLDHMAVPTSLLVVLDGIVQEPEHSYSTNNNVDNHKLIFQKHLMPLVESLSYILVMKFLLQHLPLRQHILMSLMVTVLLQHLL